MRGDSCGRVTRGLIDGRRDAEGGGDGATEEPGKKKARREVIFFKNQRKDEGRKGEKKGLG